MTLFSDIYRGSSVFLTGHTGFKGTWMSLWLKMLGADVTGVALDPSSKPCHWDLIDLDMVDNRFDIREAQKLTESINIAKPKIVFHFAAQPLVRHSYIDPLSTWSSNVMGTANLLEACRQQPSVKAIVVISSDKCYENNEWLWGYRENDRLGGYDPYSASKACTELVVGSYRNAFFSTPESPLLASARAGNVIGGGDWSMDRLIPDIVRSVSEGKSLKIRSPKSTRPWQHVLESLSGYLLLGQNLLQGRRELAEPWNFGPAQEGNREVEGVLSSMKKVWPALDWEIEQSAQPHEASLLYLDSSKAREAIGWRPVWSIDKSIEVTASWYRAFVEQNKVISCAQLEEYIKEAQSLDVEWSCN